MRSRPYKEEFETVRDRIAETRLRAAQCGMGPIRRTCMIDRGRLLTGHKSQHRTKGARRWRTCLRIKRRIGSAMVRR